MRHGGSHLIRPIVAKLGFDIIEPGNFGARLDEKVGPVIVFLRDPRDRMVSTMRWWRGKPRKAAQLAKAGDTDDLQILYLLKDQGFMEEMLVWANIWCKFYGPRLQLNFERMSILTVGTIARYLNLGPNEKRDERIFLEVYEHSRTYTGKHSKWQDSFGPLSLEYWNNNGGSNLLSLMGYVW